jgi:predicted nucleic acid-binding protein
VVKALLDTNILIDFLRGVPAARDELNRYSDKATSRNVSSSLSISSRPSSSQQPTSARSAAHAARHNAIVGA